MQASIGPILTRQRISLNTFVTPGVAVKVIFTVQSTKHYTTSLHKLGLSLRKSWGQNNFA